MQNGRRVVVPVPAVAEVIEDVPGIFYSLDLCERSSTFYDSSTRQIAHLKIMHITLILLVVLSVSDSKSTGGW